MDEKVNAVVLRAADWGENDKVLTLFSLEEGVVSAGIKGVKKAGAKLRFAAQPLSLSEYVLASRAGRRTVIGASGLDSFYDLRTDIRCFYAASAAAEFCLSFLPEGIVSPALFFSLCELLKTLCARKGDAGIAAVRFLSEGLALAGYAADFGDCARCGAPLGEKIFFDFEEGACVCGECCAAGDAGMSPATYRLLGALASADYGDLPAADRETVRRALKFLSYFTEYKAGVSLKALGELTGLYAELGGGV